MIFTNSSAKKKNHNKKESYREFEQNFHFVLLKNYLTSKRKTVALIRVRIMMSALVQLNKFVTRPRYLKFVKFRAYKQVVKA